jgi:hypothetical protein
VKPPEQPHAIEACEVSQGVFVTAVGEQLQLAALLGGRRWLVAGLKLHLLAGAEKADGLKGERRGQAANKPGPWAEVTTEVERDRTAP